MSSGLLGWEGRGGSARAPPSSPHRGPVRRRRRARGGNLAPEAGHAGSGATPRRCGRGHVPQGALPFLGRAPLGCEAAGECARSAAFLRVAVAPWQTHVSLVGKLEAVGTRPPPARPVQVPAEPLRPRSRTSSQAGSSERAVPRPRAGVAGTWRPLLWCRPPRLWPPRCGCGRVCRGKAVPGSSRAAPLGPSARRARGARGVHFCVCAAASAHGSSHFSSESGVSSGQRGLEPGMCPRPLAPETWHHPKAPAPRAPSP